MFLLDIMRRKTMERFLKRYKDRLVGSIAGFDRLLFRGTLRSIKQKNARAGLPPPS
jgi:hypothetical protein